MAADAVADAARGRERRKRNLWRPRALGAPEPIRVARAPSIEDGGFPAMVSPITGQPAAAAEPAEDHESGPREEMSAPASLAERLSRGARLGTALAEVSE